MIGGSALTSILGAHSTPITDVDTAKAYVRALCDADLAVMMILPGTKEPADMRTPAKRRNDDKAARESAKEAGRLDAEKVKAPAGLYLATADKTVACRYVEAYFKAHTKTSQDGAVEPPALNLAIEVGASHLVVIDADTDAQVAEFLAMCGAPPDLPPTVRSPGKQNPDGTWVHSNGGHFYFTVSPDEPLPTDVGSTVIGETGIAVLWHNRYVLIPPSCRPEGCYELTGREYPLPAALRELIENRCAARAERATAARARVSGDVDGEIGLGTRIEEWARDYSWSDILAPAGWIPVSRPDMCGCPVLTAPGDHANPKSATAHDAGCSKGWTSDLNAPLHIWTDHPGEPFETWISEHDGLSTITKFQAVAALEYGGDQAKAMGALGIAPSMGVDIEGVDVRKIAAEDASIDNLSEDLLVPSDRLRNAAQEVIDHYQSDDVYEMADDGNHTPQQIQEMSLHQLAGVGVEPQGKENDEDFPIIGEVDETTGLYVPILSGVPQMAPFHYWAYLPPPEYVVNGLLEHGGLSSIIGQGGVGKSSVAVDLMCHVATGRSWQGRAVLKTRVLYLPGEGLAGVVARLRAWCEAREVDYADVGTELILGNAILQLGATKEAWAELRDYIARQQIGLIVFDTFARMSVGIEENSATDVGKAIRRFDQVREMTHAGVMVVHHTGKSDPNVGRGSSALQGALDSELLVRSDGDRISVPDPETGRDAWARPIALSVTKQKNAEMLDEPIDLLMTNWRDAAPLITGPTGRIDPMQGEVLLARPVPETLIETAVRVRLWVDRFTEQGCTRADIAHGVRPDAYTAGLRNTERQWRLKVSEAVDRSLHWGLLETLEGSSARYISGSASIAQARTVSGQEAGIPDAI